MDLEIPDNAYREIIEEIRAAFAKQREIGEKHLAEALHDCAKNHNIGSVEIENFVAVSCSHAYYDAMIASEEVIKEVVVTFYALMADAIKLSAYPPKSFDTSPEASTSSECRSPKTCL